MPLDDLAEEYSDIRGLDLVLDFDREGRLIGIEVPRPDYLPPDLVEQAEILGR